MNDRVHKIRKSKGLSQERFGKRLGVTKTSISRLESGINNVTDTMIKLICSEFGVNEEWLRTGQGDMYIETNVFSLDEYSKKNNLTSLEIDIIKGYIELNGDIRQNLVSHFKAIFDKHAEIAATKEDCVDIDKEVESYRRELEAEQKGETSLVLPDSKEKLG